MHQGRQMMSCQKWRGKPGNEKLGGRIPTRRLGWAPGSAIFSRTHHVRCLWGPLSTDTNQPAPTGLTF